jgi:hypothetical protein
MDAALPQEQETTMERNVADRPVVRMLRAWSRTSDVGVVRLWTHSQ